MRFIFFFAFYLIANTIHAQIPSMPPGARGNTAQMNMGRFYGKIIDTKTGKPIDAASVQLLQNKFDSATKTRKEVIVSGQLTRANGDFSLENLSIMGQYKLKVTAIGFKTYQQNVSFALNMNGAKPGDMSQMLNNIDKDLGNIKLEEEVKQLSEVVVEGTRPTLQLGVDRKIFNVDRNIVSQGGTAVDVMRNVPTVDVDVEGNISLRNNAPQIFVDGRPSVLSLDQIPADAIQTIELITNPSAKFDASGGQSAIINIVLKKNKRVGYSGNVRTGIDMRGRPNFGGDINVRQAKINTFANVNYSMRKNKGWGETDRDNLIPAGDLSNLFLRNNNVSTGNFAF
ncbi:MAG: carboxypeptidase regulatory-like domain-containing protein, partial [Chitinophagaceae bacterium]